jgi:signal transduction histidine kinase
MGGFVAIAILTGVAGYFSVTLSDHIWSLRRVELPMEQHLGQIEESLWHMIHGVDVYVSNVNLHDNDLYKRQFQEVKRRRDEYAALIDTEREEAVLFEFDHAWSSIQATAERVVALAQQVKEVEDRFFVYVDQADDVIDFQIQDRLSNSDPDILIKERAVREVEVSIWEAIHAAQQYTGLAPNISRADHAQKNFAELMEKQFDDVEEFWPRYTALAHSEEEKKAIAAFEALWGKAVVAGRDVIKLHDQTIRQMRILDTSTHSFDDDLIDGKMRRFVHERIAVRDKEARQAKIIVILLGVGAILGAVLVGLAITRYISKRVARLMNATVALSRGNLKHRIRTSQKDEFGMVSEAFDHMAEQLDASTEILEEQIAHRAAAEESLTHVNAELTTAMAKLSGANDELREFVYIASHDLREPLRKISSFGSILRDSLERHLSEDDRENLMFMIDGADRMTKMIEGLLTYSRLNTSEKVRDVIDLNHMIRELENLELGAVIEETNATIEIPQPLPNVTGHPAQISQLLQNLIANGIKYHREGVQPEITITADEETNGRVRISVHDNGIGIPEEHYGNIFKMFRRLHSRRKYQGTGIGLAVCKRIVDKHDGRIDVDSRPDQGTTFSFTLPRAEVAEAEIAVEAVASSA